MDKNEIIKLLEQFTVDELRALADKKELEEKIKTMPKPLDNPDWSHVNQGVTDYIENVARGISVDTNYWKNYIFKSAVGTVFGKEVWEWINAIIII